MLLKELLESTENALYQLGQSVSTGVERGRAVGKLLKKLKTGEDPDEDGNKVASYLSGNNVDIQVAPFFSTLVGVPLNDTIENSDLTKYSRTSKSKEALLAGLEIAQRNLYKIRQQIIRDLSHNPHLSVVLAGTGSSTIEDLEKRYLRKGSVHQDIQKHADYLIPMFKRDGDLSKALQRDSSIRVFTKKIDDLLNSNAEQMLQAKSTKSFQQRVLGLFTVLGHISENIELSIRLLDGDADHDDASA